MIWLEVSYLGCSSHRVRLGQRAGPSPKMAVFIFCLSGMTCLRGLVVDGCLFISYFVFMNPAVFSRQQMLTTYLFMFFFQLGIWVYSNVQCLTLSGVLLHLFFF